MSSWDYVFTDYREEIPMRWIPIEVSNYAHKNNEYRSTMYQCSNCGNISEVMITRCQYCGHSMEVPK